MRVNDKSRLRGLWGALLVTATISHVAGSAQSMIPGYPAPSYRIRPEGSRKAAELLPIHTDFRASVPGGDNQGQINYWYSVMGEPFHAMHHYCWGLMKLNRALYLARSAQVSVFYFRDAILEFDYVLERSPENFILRPEILTKKGQISSAWAGAPRRSRSRACDRAEARLLATLCPAE